MQSYKRVTFSWLALVLFWNNLSSSAFTPNAAKSTSSVSVLYAKPQRLADNAEGVVYVNDKCINCAACSGFAPDTFERRGRYHVVHRQPETSVEIEKARAALSACPVAAIRLDSLAERRRGVSDKVAVEDSWTEQDEKIKIQISDRKATKPFPRPLLDIPNAYWIGHHNEASFGAIPYLIRAKVNDNNKWIMVDTPKFSKVSRNDVISITGEAGPDYLFLTHVDDTADHQKWAEEFNGLQQIFHSGDLGRHNWIGDKTLEDVEILLPNEQHQSEGLGYFTIDGKVLSEIKDTDDDVAIVHTPGHSPGSITLFHRPSKVIFTGDTYARSAATGTMTAFPRYGNNLRVQVDTLKHLMKIDWEIVAPGHGHYRDYRGESEESRGNELEAALSEMTTFAR